MIVEYSGIGFYLVNPMPPFGMISETKVFIVGLKLFKWLAIDIYKPTYIYAYMIYIIYI